MAHCQTLLLNSGGSRLRLVDAGVCELIRKGGIWPRPVECGAPSAILRTRKIGSSKRPETEALMDVERDRITEDNRAW